ncbi:ceramide synthase 6-like isoform X2 [Rhopilema esculentum]|uniref:ceramide synthase 6-like isoform X2 n=1 Tax=Rhopilema esculentum TaxID=499914 RepID=UPI0031D9F36D
MAGLLDVIWSESFWLPKGRTWDDLKSTDTITKPQADDLYIVPPLAILLLVVRFLFERFIARPLCIYLGIEDKPRKEPEPNVICEKVFHSVSKRPDENVIKGLCNQLGWSDFKVRQWFTRRRNISKLPVMRKATESCWRFLFYISAFLYGFGVLIRKDWFFNSDEWFIGYLTDQSLESDIRWYYIIELAFYVSLLSSVLVDNKRKDFWEMTIHHFITILLIGGSYVIGHFRIGSVIIVVHDSSDYWLESAKVANYAKMQRTCDGLFVGFALTFFLSRWVVYPFWVLYSFTKTWYIIGPFQSYYWFAFLLGLLQILHILWGFHVARVVYTFTVSGKVERDVRSEDEDEDPVEEKEPAVQAKKKK